MMFDNSPPEPTKTSSRLHQAAVAIAIVGLLIMFVSMHLGAFTVMAVGAAHLVLGAIGVVRTRAAMSGSESDR